jgi:hypothetical protein
MIRPSSCLSRQHVCAHIINGSRGPMEITVVMGRQSGVEGRDVL